MSEEASLQMTYWIGSTVLCTVGWIALLSIVPHLLFYYRYHGSLKSVAVFLPILLGDLLFISAYTPQHYFNVHSRRLDSEYVITSGALCDYSAVMGAAGFWVSLLGLFLALYQPVYIVIRSKQCVRTSHLPYKFTVINCVMSIIFGVGYSLYLRSVGDVGPFQGLFCTYNNFDKFRVGGVFTLFASLLFVATVLFPIVVFGNAAKTELIMTQHLKKQRKSRFTRLVIHTLKIFGLLVFLWGPIFLSFMVGFVSDKSMPEQFDLCAGWLAKLKVIGDVLVIRSFPIVKDFIGKVANDQRMPSVRKISLGGGMVSMNTSIASIGSFRNKSANKGMAKASWASEIADIMHTPVVMEDRTLMEEDSFRQTSAGESRSERTEV